MLKFALICLFLFINFDYSKGKTPAIINGTVITDMDEARFFVGITTKKDKGFFVCGGTLFARNKVLTAAHCFRDFNINNAERVSIKYGTKERKDNTKEIKASKIVVHPKYDFHQIKPKKNKGDLAVITLSEPIEEGANVKYAELQTAQIPVNSKVTVYGWGRTNVLKDPHVEGTPEFPSRLLKAILTFESFLSKAESSQSAFH